MHIGHRYGLWQTIKWSSEGVVWPFFWALVISFLYEGLGFRWVGIPTLPMSLVGIGVAFYLGFKNNASYDRLWEARKIWGAIVNASRSWAYSARDLVGDLYGGSVEEAELQEIHDTLVHRHVAWMDALRHQLRKVKSWEHNSAHFMRIRQFTNVPEFKEELAEVLRPNLDEKELEEALSMINPAAYLLSQQSRHLATLRRRELLDGFSHMELQGLLQELMTQQGKAERIKNFPFPRQYATVNYFFAMLFAILLPFGLLPEFAKLGNHMAWLTVPFAVIVSWVFLTTDKIGEWSENPFEGLANDVPITSMARGIERDIRQMNGEQELPPPREPDGSIMY